MTALRQRIDELEREVARLRETLEPFIRIAAVILSRTEARCDDGIWSRYDDVSITYGDLRRARAALSETGEATAAEQRARNAALEEAAQVAVKVGQQRSDGFWDSSSRAVVREAVGQRIAAAIRTLKQETGQ